MTQDELELTPGAPITVALSTALMRVFGTTCSHERVLTVSDRVINYGNGRNNHVRREDEGKTWVRGWDTKDAQAFEAQLILELSV